MLITAQSFTATQRLHSYKFTVVDKTVVLFPNQRPQSLVWEWGSSTREIASCSLVPRLSQNMNMYCGESLVYFLRKHDIIKIGPKQKGYVVQPAMLQHSECMIFDARYVVICPIPSRSFSCSELRVCQCTIKVSLPPLYPPCFSCEK